MNVETPDFISDLADAVGGTVKEVGIHPDGESGFATMSMPLPEDHWLYETDEKGFQPRPHYPMLAGNESLARDYLARLIVNHGGKYGVKAATSNGREDDFDPDALVRNIELGLFGLRTSSGLSGNPDDQRLFDPIQPGNLGQVLLEAVALAIHDGLISGDEACAAAQPVSVAAAKARWDEAQAERQRAHRELCIRKGWATTEDQAAPELGGDLINIEAADHE